MAHAICGKTVKFMQDHLQVVYLKLRKEKKSNVRSVILYVQRVVWLCIWKADTPTIPFTPVQIVEKFSKMLNSTLEIQIVGEVKMISLSRPRLLNVRKCLQIKAV